jgi:hypothetical protein
MASAEACPRLMAVEGWRVWELEDQAAWVWTEEPYNDWHLLSPVTHEEWAGGTFSATCLLCDAVPCFDACPSCARLPRPCGKCGIYLLDSPAAAVERSGHLDSATRESFVLGMARGWGRTVHHEHGWRVEHAQVAGFVVKPGAELAEIAAQLVGVPLYSFDEAVQLAAA